MNRPAVVYQIALPIPRRRLFDYLPPENAIAPLDLGHRVWVPFGKQKRMGIVLAKTDRSELPIEQLKPIDSVCDETPLFPPSLCDFIKKIAHYYHYPIGEVAFTGWPTLLRKGKVPTHTAHTFSPAADPERSLVLNTAQQSAIDAILSDQKKFQPFLLEGITGSGKTEVYLQVARQIFASHKQILVLIPEISLTSQTVERFVARFSEHVFAYHSRISPTQRAAIWMKVRSQTPVVIIGTRSAIFLPFDNLGLILVDEEHDPSFKQQEGLRYSARDAAVLRAQASSCPVVLGSATPAFETLFNVASEKYKALSLPYRATHTALPRMLLYDIRHKKLDGGLSSQLLAHVKSHLAQNGQVLFFINRRGFSPVLMCYDCGWLAMCHRCDAKLTYHQNQQQLICHHCLYQHPCPSHCPACQAHALHPVGQGTERIEQTLATHFPTFPIVRLDSDVTRQKGMLTERLQLAESNTARLVIGTQILAKGHHFPHLSLVCIVDADAGLFSTDFRAIEKMAQLIIQVGGRAGRVHAAGEVIIQTLHPEHPLLQKMLVQNYSQLATELLQERQRCKLPPFSHWALLRAEARSSELPLQLLHDLQQHFQQYDSLVSLLGPLPAPMHRRQGRYRYQLLIQSNDRRSLHRLLSHSADLLERHPLSKKVRWSLDVDPIEML